MRNTIEDLISTHIKDNPNIMSQTISNYIAIIEASDDLSFDLERELVKKAKFDDDAMAKSELFSSHVKLVFGVAKKYIIPSINFEDLVQEGLLGLEDALEHFELERGLRFSTPAKWWVRARILKYIKNNIRSFSIPTEATTKIFAVSRCAELLNKERGHIPSDREIGDELGMHEGHISFLRKFLNHSVPLDEKLNTDSGGQQTTAQDLLVDDRNNAQESLIRDDGILSIRSAIEKLPYAQKFVIENRYGLGCEELTLKEVGKLLHLSTERIRQIQNDAERRLKLMVNK